MTAYGAKLIERSDHYIAVKPVRSNGGWAATLVCVSPEMIESREKLTVGNKIKRYTPTCMDLRQILAEDFGCSVSELTRFNERELLDMFHESFAGRYGNSSGKNIEIAKYEGAKERDKKDGKNSAVWRVE